MANLVEEFAPPHTISWQPGMGPDDANLELGGWMWRYDLRPELREHIEFPPFPVEHLHNSLANLSKLAVSAMT